MIYLLDTDICIYAMAGRFPGLGARMAECGSGELAVSMVTFSEILVGIARGKQPSGDVVEAFFEQVLLLPYDEAAARAYSRLPARDGSFDRLIAAHALSLGATIVTNNEADFADVEGLLIENWTVPR